MDVIQWGVLLSNADTCRENTCLWQWIPFLFAAYWCRANPIIENLSGQANCNTCSTFNQVFLRYFSSEKCLCLFNLLVILKGLVVSMQKWPARPCLLWTLCWCESYWGRSNPHGCLHPMQSRKGKLALHMLTHKPDIYNHLPVSAYRPSYSQQAWKGDLAYALNKADLNWPSLAG